MSFYSTQVLRPSSSNDDDGGLTSYECPGSSHSSPQDVVDVRSYLTAERSAENVATLHNQAN